MKKLLYLTGILLFTATTIYAQDCINNLNEEAKRLYSKADIAAQNAKTEADYLYAIVELKKALQYAPDCPDINYNIGITYEKSAGSGKVLKDIDRLKQAIKYLKKYLELQPNAQDKQEVQDKISELEVRYDKLSIPIIKKTQKPVQFGFSVGFNNLLLNYSGTQEYEDSYNGMRFGIFFEFRLSNLISIQPGANITYISENDIMLYEFPIDMLLKYNFGRNKLYAGIGPVVGLSGDDLTGDKKNASVGLNLKAGYSFRAFFIEFGYNSGLFTVDNSYEVYYEDGNSISYDGKLKINSFFASLGLKF